MLTRNAIPLTSPLPALFALFTRCFQAAITWHSQPVKRARRVQVSAGLLTLLLSAFSSATFADVNATKKGLAAGGYDLVSYFTLEEPLKGEKDIVASYMDHDYRFSSAENKALFEQNPEQYLPEYGGYCAWAMLDGEKVDVNPKFYKIVDGKLYLFYKGLLGNTLENWNERAETEPENKMIELADYQWATILAVEATE